MSRSLHRWYSLPDLDGLADREVELRGELEVKQLSRLRDMLHTDSGSVSVALSIRRGGEGWLGLDLRYRAILCVVCQRCLEPMEFEATAQVGLGLVESAAVELPPSREPVLLEGDRLQPMSLLEDELIMGLPLVPKHRTIEECGSLAKQFIDLETRDPASRNSH